MAAGDQVFVGGATPGAADFATLMHQADVTAVTQVVLHERQGRDRGWWDQMRAAYWPDARIQLSWFQGDGAGFVERSRALFEQGIRPIHRAYAPIVTVRGPRAHAEVPVMIYSGREMNGRPARLISFVRLNYRLEKRGREWRIAAFDVVYEYCEATSAAPDPTLGISVEELAHYRPSYDVLSWSIAGRGMTPSQEELGDDRPAALVDYYAGVRRWVTEGGGGVES